MLNKVCKDINEVLKWKYDFNMFQVHLTMDFGSISYISRIDNIYLGNDEIEIIDDLMDDEFQFEMYIDVRNVKELVLGDDFIKLINAKFAGVVQNVTIKFFNY